MTVGTMQFGKIAVLVNFIIQKSKFCKLLSFWLYSFLCHFLSWEKIWEDWEKILNTKSESKGNVVDLPTFRKRPTQNYLTFLKSNSAPNDIMDEVRFVLKNISFCHILIKYTDRWQKYWVIRDLSGIGFLNQK